MALKRASTSARLHDFFRQLSGIGLVAALADGGLKFLQSRAAIDSHAGLHRLHDGLDLLGPVQADLVRLRAYCGFVPRRLCRRRVRSL